MADFGQFARFDAGQLLNPAYPDPRNKLMAAQFAANLTISKGQAVATNTSTLLMGAFNRTGSNGTNLIGGFAQYPFKTDASGTVYNVLGSTAAGATFYDTGISIAAFWSSGVFNPYALTTAATGSSVAEVDTITPTNPTTGDIYSVANANGVLAEFTVAGTQTATATVTGLKNSWNANPEATAIATASGTATLILTAVNSGEPMNLTATAVGTGTVALVITTAAVSALQSEVDLFTPATITTGDVNTITITYPNLTTYAVSVTVGATATAAALGALFLAAWNNSPAGNYGTMTLNGSSYPVITAVNAGQTMSLASSVVGTGTLTKSVTTPAYGRNFADVLAGRPGAYIEQPDGFWVI